MRPWCECPQHHHHQRQQQYSSSYKRSSCQGHHQSCSSRCSGTLPLSLKCGCPNNTEMTLCSCNQFIDDFDENNDFDDGNNNNERDSNTKVSEIGEEQGQQVTETSQTENLSSLNIQKQQQEQRQIEQQEQRQKQQQEQRQKQQQEQRQKQQQKEQKQQQPKKVTCADINHYYSSYCPVRTLRGCCNNRQLTSALKQNQPNKLCLREKCPQSPSKISQDSQNNQTYTYLFKLESSKYGECGQYDDDEGLNAKLVITKNLKSDEKPYSAHLTIMGGDDDDDYQDWDVDVDGKNELKQGKDSKDGKYGKGKDGKGGNDGKEGKDGKGVDSIDGGSDLSRYKTGGDRGSKGGSTSSDSNIDEEVYDPVVKDRRHDDQQSLNEKKEIEKKQLEQKEIEKIDYDKKQSGRKEAKPKGNKKDQNINNKSSKDSKDSKNESKNDSKNDSKNNSINYSTNNSINYSINNSKDGSTNKSKKPCPRYSLRTSPTNCPKRNPKSPNKSNTPSLNEEDNEDGTTTLSENDSLTKKQKNTIKKDPDVVLSACFDDSIDLSVIKETDNKETEKEEFLNEIKKDENDGNEDRLENLIKLYEKSQKKQQTQETIAMPVTTATATITAVKGSNLIGKFLFNKVQRHQNRNQNDKLKKGDDEIEAETIPVNYTVDTPVLQFSRESKVVNDKLDEPHPIYLGKSLSPPTLSRMQRAVYALPKDQIRKFAEYPQNKSTVLSHVLPGGESTKPKK